MPKGKKPEPYLTWNKAFAHIGSGCSKVRHKGEPLRGVETGEKRYVAIGLIPNVRQTWIGLPHLSKAAAIKEARWMRRGYVIELNAILVPESK